MEAELVQQRQRLEQFSRKGGRIATGRRIRVTEEQTGDGIFRQVHSQDSEAEQAGADRQARLGVDRPGGGSLRKREGQLLRPERREGGHVRGCIDPKALGQPVPCTVLQKNIHLRPEPEVPS